MGAAIDLFSTIGREIDRKTRASALLGTDATGLPVLDEDHPNGIRNGTMWCWVGDGTWVTFFYAKTGDADSVKDFLGDEQCDFIPPKTPLGNAIGYLRRQWHRLILFLTDGRIELTNNRFERELRALVLGRKNWLFAYGDLGGKRTATILTVLGTCIAHRINPRAYLHVVAKLIVHGFPNDRLRDLLPDRIGLLHPELRLPPRAPRSPPSLPAPS